MANRKPKPAPRVENWAAFPAAPPITLPATTSRPKPSATLAFQNPAAEMPISDAIASVRSCRLRKKTASPASEEGSACVYAASI